MEAEQKRLASIYIERANDYLDAGKILGANLQHIYPTYQVLLFAIEISLKAFLHYKLVPPEDGHALSVLLISCVKNGLPVDADSAKIIFWSDAAYRDHVPRYSPNFKFSPAHSLSPTTELERAAERIVEYCANLLNGDAQAETACVDLVEVEALSQTIKVQYHDYVHNFDPMRVYKEGDALPDIPLGTVTITRLSTQTTKKAGALKHRPPKQR